MMVSIKTASVIGVKAVPIDVEVDIVKRGFPTFTIVGLPSKGIDEAKDRVRTAIRNSGFTMPDAKITVNLAPADIPKHGSAFDLPIAIGILAASGEISQEEVQKKLFFGELSLHGYLRKIQGIVPIFILADERSTAQIFFPKDNIEEIHHVPKTTAYAPNTLSTLVKFLCKQVDMKAVSFKKKQSQSPDFEFDFAHVRGQMVAKRALEIAAAGFHNIHLTGVPGAGKTMLARAFSSILPPLNESEQLEVSAIYSSSDHNISSHVVSSDLRPYRSPHHTISKMGLIGGGSHPKPGEISLAHRGVLFLDEFPEFPRSVLESLRQPLEDGVVTIARASGSIHFPSRFQLIAASNPCPCGHYGDEEKECICSPVQIHNYRKKLSGPLMDRIDMHIAMHPVKKTEFLENQQSAESSKEIRERILVAQQIMQNRFKDLPVHANSEMTSQHIRQMCTISTDAESLLQKAVQNMQLSARAYFKIIKISQTIADLGGQSNISSSHVAEALQYR